MEILIRTLRLAAVLLVVAAAPAVAGEWRDYDRAAFAEAQQAGQTIFVAVHADWCPSCRAQRPTLASVIGDAAFQDAVAFVVDFDTEDEFLIEHQIRYQTTLIVFKGTTETGRSLGEQDRGRIRALFATGL